VAAEAEAERVWLLNGVAQLIADVECQPPSPGGSPRPATISVKGVVDTVLRFQGCKVVQKEDADGDAEAAEVMEACRRIFETVEAAAAAAAPAPAASPQKHYSHAFDDCICHDVHYIQFANI
jgi:hypothetical protein